MGTTTHKAGPILAYRETILPCRKLYTTKHAMWDKEGLGSPGLGWGHSSGTGVRGVRSLLRIAIQVVADNIVHIPDDFLDLIPTNLTSMIWLFVQRKYSERAPLYAWKVLSKRLVMDCDVRTTLSLFSHRNHICDPIGPLSLYTSPLSSPGLDFISSLTITAGCEFSVSELVALSDLPNLGVLEFVSPLPDPTDPNGAIPGPLYPDITNSLIKTWATKPNPFPALRVLRIWAPGSLSEDMLVHLGKFPSLTIFDVVGDYDLWQNASRLAKHYGWKPECPSSPMQDPLLAYFQQILPPAKEHLSDKRWFTGQSAYVDAELRHIGGRGNDRVVKVPRRARMPLHDVLDLRRRRQDNNPLYDYYTHHPPSHKYQPKIDTGYNNVRDSTSPTPGRYSTCNGGLSQQMWHFWLYAFVGHVRYDEDLMETMKAAKKALGLPTQEEIEANTRRTEELDSQEGTEDYLYTRPVDEVRDTEIMYENLVLPALPFAELTLGHYSRTRKGVGEGTGTGGPIPPSPDDTLRYVFVKVDLEERYIERILARNREVEEKFNREAKSEGEGEQGGEKATGVGGGAGSGESHAYSPALSSHGLRTGEWVKRQAQRKEEVAAKGSTDKTGAPGKSSVVKGIATGGPPSRLQASGSVVTAGRPPAKRNAVGSSEELKLSKVAPSVRKVKKAKVDDFLQDMMKGV